MDSAARTQIRKYSHGNFRYCCGIYPVHALAFPKEFGEHTLLLPTNAGLQYLLCFHQQLLTARSLDIHRRGIAHMGRWITSHPSQLFPSDSRKGRKK